MLLFGVVAATNRVVCTGCLAFAHAVCLKLFDFWAHRISFYSDEFGLFVFWIVVQEFFLSLPSSDMYVWQG
jgi:hypothetical protein